MKNYLGHLTLLIILSAVLLDFPAPYGFAVFTDVTKESGIHTVTYSGSQEKKHLLESVGCGTAFLDYNRDGNQDIYIVNGWKIEDKHVTVKGKNALYRNTGNGTFEEVTEQAKVGDKSWGIGVCTTDYNNDGWIDIYVTNFGANRLYHNNQDGTFTDVATQVGVNDKRWSVGASFLDFDKDGDLDLYVVNYVTSSIQEVLEAKLSQDWKGVTNVMKGPQGLKGAADAFYRNNGDGTFTDATAESGLIDIGMLYGLGICTTDYDLDGDIDIYIANDASPNYLYQNNGNGTFTEIGLYANASVANTGLPQASMGIDFADFDNDGDFDGILTHFSGECSTLYRNLGDGFFEDASESVGLWQRTYLPMSWGTGFFDYDNDMDLDLFIANGHIYPQVDSHLAYGESYAQPNQLFNNSKDYFKETTSEAGDGFKIRLSSRGTAFADYDNDGDLDVLVINMDALPTLLRNDGGNAKNWLSIELKDQNNISGIGSIVTVKIGNLTQTREIRSGNSYASQNELRTHFGLGNADLVDEISVKWLSGARTTLHNIAARQLIQIVEPKTNSEN